MDDGHHDANNEQRLARHCQQPGRIAGCSRVQSATTSAHCIIPSPQQGPTASTVLLSGQRDAHYQTSPTDSTGIDCKSLNSALLGTYYKRDLRPAQQEEEAGLAQGKHARQHRTAAARVLSAPPRCC
jgi:hypothetical protein